MHIVTPKLVPKTYNNMIKAPVIQTVQTQSLVKLSYFRSAIGVYSLYSLFQRPGLIFDSICS